MATRDNLPIIRAARTGAATAQLALGARYVSGKSGLPQSTGTAFYWLERAARQGLNDAALMIGRHVPYDLVAAMPHPYEAAPWYEKAFEAGVPDAGLVFARLVLENAGQCDAATTGKALSVLKALADGNDRQAQWMLAQHLQRSAPGPASSRYGEQLTQQAASAGVEEAQYALLQQAWSASDFDAYRQRAAPLAEKLLRRHKSACAHSVDEPPATPVLPMLAQEVTLLVRLAQALQQHADAPVDEVRRLLEMAALAGSPAARFTLGLQHARIDRQGRRSVAGHGVANYRKAVPWLLLAARDGMAEAWHALSRVYAKSEFSQRDLQLSRRYLERAAEMGLLAAQSEYAHACWRNRRDAPLNDVRALYWWKQAEAQGDARAGAALRDFARRPQKGAWAERIRDRLTTLMRKTHPFLCARLDLAAAFGLSRPEALLIDMRRGDHGHCLEVDISAYHAKSRRRLVLIESEEQRAALTSATRLFGDVDCGIDGPEGNYRQRQYRLKTLLPALGS